jgi:protein-tyrosine phosphatase
MKILMVCLGNICRSPLADGVLRDKVIAHNLNDVLVDSCGTSSYHIGGSPDERMIATAKNHGYDISNLRARQFTVADFDEFDLIYVMDSSNYNNVVKLARNNSDNEKVKLFLNELHPNQNMAVPDPYFGENDGFDHVFDLVDQTTDVIIEKIKDER